MIFLYLTIYFGVFTIFDFIYCGRRYKVYEIKDLRLCDGGISFKSNLQHKVDISNCKYVFCNEFLCIYTGKNLVKIANVKGAYVFKNFLYFTGLGEVKFLCDFSARNYLSFDIKSQIIDVCGYKELALRELVVNLFDFDKCENLKKFLKIIKKVLKIHVFNDKIVINQNKFHLSYILTYKIKNKIKKIFVN